MFVNSIFYKPCQVFELPDREYSKRFYFKNISYKTAPFPVLKFKLTVCAPAVTVTRD